MNKGALLVGGIAATLSAFTAKYIYTKFFSEAKTLNPERKVILSKLKAVREALFPIMYQIAHRISEEFIPRGLSPTESKKFLLEESNSPFLGQIQDVLNERVFNDIEEDVFWNIVEKDYAQDPEIQFHKKEYLEEFQKCFLGIQPSIQTTQMIHIDQERLLRVIEEILDKKLQDVKEIFDKHYTNKAQGRFSQNTVQQLERALLENEQQFQIKRKEFLKQLNIPGEKMLEIIVAKFLNESTTFRGRYRSLTENYQKSLNSLKINEN